MTGLITNGLRVCVAMHLLSGNNVAGNAMTMTCDAWCSNIPVKCDILRIQNSLYYDPQMPTLTSAVLMVYDILQMLRTVITTVHYLLKILHYSLHVL